MKIIKSIISSFVSICTSIFKGIYSILVYLFTGIKNIAISVGKAVWYVLKKIKYGTFYIASKIWSGISFFGKMIYRYIILNIFLAFKKISILIWKFLKTIALSIYFFFRWLAIKIYLYLIKPIFLAFKFIAMWIYKILVKYILYSIYKVIKFIFTWIFRIIVEYVILNFVNFFIWSIKGLWKYVIKPIGRFFKIVSIWIYKNIFVNIFKGFKFILKLVYRLIKFFLKWIYKIIVIYILKNIYKFFKWLFTNIYRFFKWFFTDIYRFFKWLFINIYRIIIKPIYNLFYNIFKFIWKKIILNILSFFEMIFRGLIYVIDYILFIVMSLIEIIFNGIVYFFKCGYKALPDFIYLLSKTIVINFILSIHLIIILLPKFIIKDVVYKFFKYLINGLKFAIKKIIETIKIAFKEISKFIKKIYHQINKLFKISFEFIVSNAKYYYVILFIPIVVPAFTILLLGSFIKTFIIMLGIFFRALFNIPYLIENEVIYIKDLYMPFVNVLKYGNKYALSLKIKILKTVKFKNLWNLVNVITWNLFFSYIICLIFALILLPINVFSFLYYICYFKVSNDIERFIRNRIICTKNNSYGIIYLRPKKYFGYQYAFDVDCNLLYDDYLEAYVVNEDVKEFTIKVFCNSKELASHSYNINYSDFYIALKEFVIIINVLETEKNSKFYLPLSSREDIKVTYTKSRLLDIINGNMFIRHEHILKSKIKVRILYKKYEIEREILLSGIIDTYKLESYLSKGLLVRKFDNLKNYLPKEYNYNFIDSDYIDKEGNIIKFDNEKFDVSFSVDGLADKIFNIEVELSLPKKIIKNALKTIKKPLIDLEDERFVIDEKIVIDKMEYFITWFINDNKHNKNDLFTTHYKYISKKKYLFKWCVIVNGKYYYGKFNVINSLGGYKNYLLYNFTDYINGIPYLHIINNEKFKNFKTSSYNKKIKYNQKYIYLPFVSIKNILCVKFKSMNRKIVKSSGMVIDYSKNECLFKVTLYYNLFIKTTCFVKVDLKMLEVGSNE